VEVEALFEGSTPLAQKLAAGGPYASAARLLTRAHKLLYELTEEEKIATLNAHPRIGEDPARLSVHSLAEQGEEPVPELEWLNATYEEKFGFRFVVFVNGRLKGDIVKVMKERLNRDRNQELETGLKAVVDIAGSRLKNEKRRSRD
jgi:2-oxo-4-hydroxy-4-carboxy--5-ureidoimidazoline (OHCU) decarboxylase